ncbi:MAG TPA: hypothetical protein VG148_01105 [Pyrinomonadaceae bacterium]|nr:hypothetical protein [Pyrinomonadaceae bacterium]
MRYVLVLLLGVLVGAVLVYIFFVGAPRARQAVGEPVRAPDPSGPPPGTAVVELDEQFFNTLLGTIFQEVGQPTFRLASAAPGGAGRAEYVRAQAGGCPNQVVLTPEGGGVRTGVRLVNNQMLAPLAFTGSYSLGQCINFRGTAEASIDLRFDQAAQTLYGQLNVAGVTLEGMSPLLSGLITVFVQNAINQRVNPLTLMSGEQISLSVPVQAAGGTLRARAADIRSDIQNGKLRLHITYDFGGAKGAPR